MASHSPSEFNDIMFIDGSIIKCTTMHDEVITGEVLAFEYDSKLLVLKSPASNRDNSSLCNLNIVNISWCKHIEIIKESLTGPLGDDNLPELNLDKIDERVALATEERESVVRAFDAGAGVDGISLYIQLSKTLGKSVSFDASNILIGDKAKVVSPYKADCILPISSKVSPNDGSIQYVKQLVEKYWRDKNKDPYSPATTSNSPASSEQSLNHEQSTPTNSPSSSVAVPVKRSPARSMAAVVAAAAASSTNSNSASSSAAPPPLKT